MIGATHDDATGLTTYTSYDSNNNDIKTSTRHLHTVGSISSYLQKSRFSIITTKLFLEIIFGGYERIIEKKNRLPANLIAIHVSK